MIEPDRKLDFLMVKFIFLTFSLSSRVCCLWNNMHSAIPVSLYLFPFHVLTAPSIFHYSLP